MTTVAHTETREHVMQGFPEHLYFELVNEELVPLLDLYELYVKLFAGDTPENAHLMNETAYFFFGNVQMTMLSFIVVRTSRLMDVPNKKSLKLLVKNIKYNLRTKADEGAFAKTETLFAVYDCDDF